MSAPMFKDDVRFLQQFLTCGGYDPKGVDGLWGPATEAALSRFEADTAAARAAEGPFDERSERNIATLHVPVQKVARRCLRALLDASFDVRILSGTRTYGEQNALYAIGRTVRVSEGKVTKARGGYSNHNFGLAWDIGLWVDGFYDGKKKPRDRDLERRADAAYRDAAAVVLGLGIRNLEWGGSWTSFPDPPHYQIATGLKLADLRARLRNGTVYV
jgi:peptidoglycan L-alanyl-D-glutamate endopeptidase CwlK